MATTSADLSLTALGAVLREVCASRPVLRVQLFGSRAEGRARHDSDVDLLVEFIPGASVGLLEMGDLKEELEERLGCHVDLLSRDAVKKSPNSYRRDSILRFPVTVYDR